MSASKMAQAKDGAQNTLSDVTREPSYTIADQCWNQSESIMSQPNFILRGVSVPSIKLREKNSVCLCGSVLCEFQQFSVNDDQNVEWEPLEDFVLFPKSKSSSMERELDSWMEEGPASESPDMCQSAPMLNDGLLDDDDTEMYLDHSRYYPLMPCDGGCQQFPCSAIVESYELDEKIENAPGSNGANWIENPLQTVESQSCAKFGIARKTLFSGPEKCNPDENDDPIEACGTHCIVPISQQGTGRKGAHSDVEAQSSFKDEVQEEAHEPRLMSGYCFL